VPTVAVVAVYSADHLLIFLLASSAAVAAAMGPHADHPG
jgi:hypothetical protein